MNNLQKTQNLCRELEMDAILLEDEVNRHYVTGLRTSSGLALITPDAAFFTTDSRYIEIAEKTLKDFTVEMRTQERKGMAIVKDWLGELKRVGFEDTLRTVKSHEKWQKDLPDIEWISVSEGISKLRAVKEDWEIERLTAAQRVTEKVFLEIQGVIKVGMTERQVAAELIYRLLKHGADKTSFDPIVVSGPNSSLPHGEPGDRIIKDGDFVTMDFGCSINGYCSDMTRTVAMGHATDEMRAVYAVV
ncbi:MAG: Xaa-Pro peptidase family protein, partial [Oscillospiraceae bacterium]|nr:Xaa-Pro peptidase family protein [Oscillospiraceae bacterium]